MIAMIGILRLPFLHKQKAQIALAKIRLMNVRGSKFQPLFINTPPPKQIVRVADDRLIIAPFLKEISDLLYIFYCIPVG